MYSQIILLLLLLQHGTRHRHMMVFV